LFMGWAVLNESLNALTIFGACAVVAGVVLLSWHGGAIKRSWPLWAIALPIGAALVRVAGHLLAKLGMEELPSPFFVGLVGYSVSCLLALGLIYSRGTGPVRVLRTQGSHYFLITGVLYAVAVYLLNIALECGDLVVVAPVVSAEPVFALLLGWLVFKEERLTRRNVTAVLLVVVGIVAVTLRHTQ
ncbi:MAG: EamA family transporter, partial [Gammaproteobacteria bacterium]|nr:EamA family transporter [Gammaproteobacteria bacterium]